MMSGLEDAFSIPNSNAATSCNEKKTKNTHTLLPIMQKHVKVVHTISALCWMISSKVANNGFFSCQFTHMLAHFLHSQKEKRQI